MNAIHCVEVALTIPDNEARTALATLQRLGVAVAGLERAELYRCEVESGAASELARTMRGLEPIFNPNKHALRIRDSDRPGAGEVWVEERDSASETVRPSGAVRIAGRTLPGVRRLWRAVAWRVFAADGRPAERDVVERATLLLCNSAFQKATLS